MLLLLLPYGLLTRVDCLLGVDGDNPLLVEGELTDLDDSLDGVECFEGRTLEAICGDDVFSLSIDEIILKRGRDYWGGDDSNLRI